MSVAKTRTFSDTTMAVGPALNDYAAAIAAMLWLPAEVIVRIIYTTKSQSGAHVKKYYCLSTQPDCVGLLK